MVRARASSAFLRRYAPQDDDSGQEPPSRRFVEQVSLGLTIICSMYWPIVLWFMEQCKMSSMSHREPVSKRSASLSIDSDQGLDVRHESKV